jgi:protein SCO1
MTTIVDFPPVNIWKKPILIAAAGLGAFFLFSTLLFAIFQPIKVLPRVRLAPGFALTDQNGEKLTNEDLRGQIILYTFTYTLCPARCVGMNTTMLTIQNKVAEMDLGGVPFTLVTISFDPEFDTPERLQAYAASLGADTDRWHFATLSNLTLLKTIVGGGFEAYYDKQPGGNFDFAPTFVLVDGWGVVRGQYRYETLSPDSERITRHVGVLAEEVQKSVGAARLAYEAAHLFLCYVP